MLFIANATKQHRVFYYRSPEAKRPQRLDIPSGRQVAIGATWPHHVIGLVTAQLDSFGAVRVADVRSSRLEKFHGLIYSHDTEIPAEVIEVGHEAVVDHQHRRAASEAAKGAASVDLNMRDQKTGKRTAKSTRVTIKQDVPHNVKPTADDIDMDVSVEEGGGPLRLPE